MASRVNGMLKSSACAWMILVGFDGIIKRMKNIEVKTVEQVNDMSEKIEDSILQKCPNSVQVIFYQNVSELRYLTEAEAKCVVYRRMKMNGMFEGCINVRV